MEGKMFFKVRHYQKQTKYYLTDKAKNVLQIAGVVLAFWGVWALAGLVYRYDLDIAQIVQNIIINLMKG
jgi:hypothetical protein